MSLLGEERCWPVNVGCFLSMLSHNCLLFSATSLHFELLQGTGSCCFQLLQFPDKLSVITDASGGACQKNSFLQTVLCGPKSVSHHG